MRGHCADRFTGVKIMAIMNRNYSCQSHGLFIQISDINGQNRQNYQQQLM